MAATETTITNIAAYKFARLFELRALRERLLEFCKARELKGSILLSPEGINLFVAGSDDGVNELLDEIRTIPGLETLAAKYSPSDHQPFNRMLVRLKKEIIAFGVDGISPADYTSNKLPAKELKRWLDEGKELVLLDTRNDYEVKLGTFREALPAGISHFRQFPGAVAKLPEELKDKPIVMFCTGGIRCEKAGPFMEKEGFKQIYQLEGGILKYFEECGGAHYDGECFVFDQRVGVDPTLGETGSGQCFACQMPLTAEEIESPLYVAEKSCPHCYLPPEQEFAKILGSRKQRLQQVISPLPGSLPYDNYRPLRVGQDHAGKTLIDFLTDTFSHMEKAQWESAITGNRILDDTKTTLAADYRVKDGQKLLHLSPGQLEPAVDGNISFLHEDAALIVIEKSAPLPMHPCGRFNRNTLQYILSQVYFPEKPKPSHRLDANTTGVVVLTRKRQFASLVQTQFSRGEVQKTYIAKAQGIIPWETHRCELPITEEYGKMGTRRPAEEGDEALAACTEFRVVTRLPDGTTLLEAKPLTGRTNQIRIHLWSLGFPICGDQAYLPGGKLGDTQTLDVQSAPLCLHSQSITLCHPITKEIVTYEAAAPSWA